MKAMPPVLSGLVQKMRIVYQGESRPIETEVISNAAITQIVISENATRLPSNDNQKKTAIERW